MIRHPSPTGNSTLPLSCSRNSPMNGKCATAHIICMHCLLSRNWWWWWGGGGGGGGGGREEKHASDNPENFPVMNHVGCVSQSGRQRA